MKVFQLFSSDYAIYLGFRNLDNYDIFVGKKMLNNWTPVQMYIYKKRKHKDYAFVSACVPAFNQKIINHIGDMLQERCELLPVEIDNSDDYTFWLVNVLSCNDFFDPQKADVKYTSDGRLKELNRFHFNEKLAEKYPIFKIEGYEHRVYVTDAFCERIESHKLKGFDFVEVWDSEVTPEMVKAKELRYQETLAEMERSKGLIYNWEDMCKGLDQGKAYASGHWKVQHDRQGQFQYAHFTVDLEYEWIPNPVYFPPVFVYSLWYEVEPSDI